MKKTNRKVRSGKVISNKMHKTIVVRVEDSTQHPKYKKIIKRFNKFKAHDEKNIANIGDLVVIEECRPVSKDKYFRLREIIKKNDSKS
ncbi:MAG: 30S ribosomal protein S17 [Candidatus Gygaella obscura]|nr:30S ribosomal protein S17 [Candidatus Gygaella obscura]